MAIYNNAMGFRVKNFQKIGLLIFLTFGLSIELYLSSAIPTSSASVEENEGPTKITLPSETLPPTKEAPQEATVVAKAPAAAAAAPEKPGLGSQVKAFFTQPISNLSQKISSLFKSKLKTDDASTVTQPSESKSPAPEEAVAKISPENVVPKATPSNADKPIPAPAPEIPAEVTKPTVTEGSVAPGKKQGIEKSPLALIAKPLAEEEEPQTKNMVAPVEPIKQFSDTELTAEAKKAGVPQQVVNEINRQLSQDEIIKNYLADKNSANRKAMQGKAIALASTVGAIVGGFALLPVSIAVTMYIVKKIGDSQEQAHLEKLKLEAAQANTELENLRRQGNATPLDELFAKNGLSPERLNPKSKFYVQKGEQNRESPSLAKLLRMTQLGEVKQAGSDDLMSAIERLRQDAALDPENTRVQTQIQALKNLRNDDVSEQKPGFFGSIASFFRQAFGLDKKSPRLRAIQEIITRGYTTEQVEQIRAQRAQESAKAAQSPDQINKTPKLQSGTESDEQKTKKQQPVAQEIADEQPKKTSTPEEIATIEATNKKALLDAGFSEEAIAEITKKDAADKGKTEQGNQNPKTAVERALQEFQKAQKDLESAKNSQSPQGSKIVGFQEAVDLAERNLKLQQEMENDEAITTKKTTPAAAAAEIQSDKKELSVETEGKEARKPLATADETPKKPTTQTIGIQTEEDAPGTGSKPALKPLPLDKEKPPTPITSVPSSISTRGKESTQQIQQATREQNSVPASAKTSESAPNGGAQGQKTFGEEKGQGTQTKTTAMGGVSSPIVKSTFQIPEDQTKIPLISPAETQETFEKIALGQTAQTGNTPKVPSPTNLIIKTDMPKSPSLANLVESTPEFPPALKRPSTAAATRPRTVSAERNTINNPQDSINNAVMDAQFKATLGDSSISDGPESLKIMSSIGGSKPPQQATPLVEPTNFRTQTLGEVQEAADKLGRTGTKDDAWPPENKTVFLTNSRHNSAPNKSPAITDFGKLSDKQLALQAQIEQKKQTRAQSRENAQTFEKLGETLEAQLKQQQSTIETRSHPTLQTTSAFGKGARVSAPVMIHGQARYQTHSNGASSWSSSMSPAVPGTPRGKTVQGDKAENERQRQNDFYRKR